MTQIRYFDFGTPQTGWTDAQQFLGVLEPGRYKGFDTISIINGTTLSVVHSSQRGLISPSIGQLDSAPTGVWVTNQGVVVKEDATIVGLANAGLDNTMNTDKRIFAVYGQHQYAASVGGTVATYGIKAGSMEGLYPVLDFPKTQVVLLYVHVPAGENATGSGVYVELPRMAALGYEDTALIDWENVFNRTQQWKQSATLATYNSSKINLNKNGNTFAVNLTGGFQFITRTGFQPGSRIVIQNRNATKRRLFRDEAIDSGVYNATYDSGYAQLYFDTGQEDGDLRYWELDQYQIAIFELVDSGTTRGQYWHLIWVSEITRKLTALFKPKPAPINGGVLVVDGTYTLESETKEVALTLSGASFPSYAFQAGNPAYSISARISVRLKVFAQIQDICVPYSSSGGGLLNYTPQFALVVTKNTMAAPTVSLRGSSGWGASIVGAPINLDGSISPVDFEPYFTIINGSIVVEAQAGDVFRLWLVCTHDLLRVKVNNLSNEVALPLAFEPITHYVG
jgi:hypothetical protein